MGKKIKLVLFTLLVLCVTSVNAQVYIDSLNKQANAMLNSFETKDYKTLLKFTHPKIVKTMGGIGPAEVAIKKALESITANGFSLKNIKIGEVSHFVKSGTLYQCLLEQISLANVNNGNFRAVNYLICMSYNSGKNWYFVNADKEKEASLKKLIPEINQELTIPEMKLVRQ